VSVLSQVNKVRQSIAHRKRKRGFDVKETPVPEFGNVLPIIPQEEETHGFIPIPESASTASEETSIKKSGASRGLLVKAVLSGFMFLFMLFLTKTEVPAIQQPKRWVTEAMTENFPFAKANAWYMDRFGSPLSILPGRGTAQELTRDEQALPVSGNVLETFRTNGEGVKIAPEKTSKVTAMRNGVVIFAGKNQKTEKTVIIQHEDGSKTTYGHLSKVDVHPYQYVARNEPIATFTPTSKSDTVYFSIEKDKKFIDPIPVKQADEKS